MNSHGNCESIAFDCKHMFCLFVSNKKNFDKELKILRTYLFNTVLSFACCVFSTKKGIVDLKDIIIRMTVM